MEEPDRPEQEPQGKPRRIWGGGGSSRFLGLTSTRRAVVLMFVVCALALSVTVPLRNYLSQRSELQEVQQQQQRLREQVDGLEQRKAELEDPAHVEAEARRRLRYVRPGETPYVVQLPGRPEGPAPATGDPAPTTEPIQPWYSDLWRDANSNP